LENTSLRPGSRRRVAHHHLPELGEVVCRPQKMPRVGGVVAHQTDQRRPVALPVVAPQLGRGNLVEPEMHLQIRRHGAIDVRKDVRARVVQRVIEIEHPHPVEFQTQRPIAAG